MNGLRCACRGFARLLLALLALPAGAVELDYGLQPVLIAPGTYVVLGAAEDFDFDNGGNVVNTAFVVTSDGVVVIDTGPSKRYGEQLRAAIARVTTQPVVRVFNTHHHPDHFFGNQAFADVPIVALPEARQAMLREGGAFADNLYAMSGPWLEGTEPLPASLETGTGIHEFGDHVIHAIAFRGHTGADLVLLDETTGTLFAGDLVFDGRTLTTPHAEVDAWLEALEQLRQLPFERVVVGHGPVRPAGESGIEATAAQLRWLTTTVRDAVGRGLSMAETMQLPIPEPYASIPLARSEFVRSVVHLYPRYEEAALPRVDVARP